MKGAIFYSSKYGSTAQYAEWISEATHLPALDIDDRSAEPSKYDLLVLGSAVLYYKPIIHKWVKRHLATITSRPTILFTVSGAPAGEKLDGWIAKSLPPSIISHMQHVALRGRQIPKELTRWDRMMLFIAALKNPDPQASKEESQGFDYMDKSSIEPIVRMVQEIQAAETASVPSPSIAL